MFRIFVRAGSDHEFRSIDLAVLVLKSIELVDVVTKQPTVFGDRIAIDARFLKSLPMISGPKKLKHVFAN
jgi:hypothetical protein